MRSDCSGDGVLMFLIGFSVGAGVALLTAPQSGKRTRRLIVRKAEDTQESLTELGEEMIARGRELVERGRAAAKEKMAEVTS